MMTPDSVMAQARHAVMQGRGAPPLQKTQDVEKARKVAEDFESFFLGQMLQPMFQGLEAEKPFGGGHAEQMWRAMQVDEYGKAIARSGGIGLADQIMRDILEYQEAGSHGNQ